MEDEKFLKTMTGIIKHVHMNKCYGFITADDSKINDVFLHHKEVEPWRKGFKLFECGQIVKFDLWTTNRGLAAKNVEIKRDKADLRDFQSVPENIGNQGEIHEYD